MGSILPAQKSNVIYQDLQNSGLKLSASVFTCVSCKNIRKNVSIKITCSHGTRKKYDLQRNKPCLIDSANTWVFTKTDDSMRLKFRGGLILEFQSQSELSRKVLDQKKWSYYSQRQSPYRGIFSLNLRFYNMLFNEMFPSFTLFTALTSLVCKYVFRKNIVKCKSLCTCSTCKKS